MVNYPDLDSELPNLHPAEAAGQAAYPVVEWLQLLAIAADNPDDGCEKSHGMDAAESLIKDAPRLLRYAKPALPILAPVHDDAVLVANSGYESYIAGLCKVAERSAHAMAWVASGLNFPQVLTAGILRGQIYSCRPDQQHLIPKAGPEGIIIPSMDGLNERWSTACDKLRDVLAGYDGQTLQVQIRKEVQKAIASWPFTPADAAAKFCFEQWQAGELDWKEILREVKQHHPACDITKLSGVRSAARRWSERIGVELRKKRPGRKAQSTA